MKALFLVLLCAILPAFASAETKTYHTYDSKGNYTGVIRERGNTSTVWSSDGKYLGRATKNRRGDINLYSGSGKYEGKVRPSRDYSNDDGEDDE